MEKCSCCGKKVKIAYAIAKGWIPNYVDFNASTPVERGALCEKCFDLLGVKYNKQTYQYYVGEYKEENNV